MSAANTRKLPQALEDLIALGARKGLRVGWAFALHAVREAARGAVTRAIRAELEAQERALLKEGAP